MEHLVIVDCIGITLEDLYHVAVDHYKVELSDQAKININNSRQVIENLIKGNNITYGVNTGFGSLKNKIISSDDLETLQHNLIQSHAVGCGSPSPMFVVRAMLLLRLCCIVRGNSGVRLSIAETLVEALNKNFCSLVYQQGTVGASGDLAPLSHLILGLMGKGLAYDTDTNTYIDASVVLNKLNMKPIKLQAKEGLACNNGTQFSNSWTALSCYHANRLIKIATIIAACTLEALHGCSNAFLPQIHECKPQTGQMKLPNK